MRAVVYENKADVRVQEVEDARIEQPTDVVVRITSTGICGSDLHMYEGRTPDAEGAGARAREHGRHRRGRRRGEVPEEGRPRGDPLQHRLRHLLQLRARARRTPA